MKEDNHETNYSQLCLTQWQTCVSLANSFSVRRDNINNIFVSLNTAIIAAICLLWDGKIILLTSAGIIMAVIWCLSIRYYRQVSKAKYDVILDLEKKLPYQPLHTEWDLCNQRNLFIEGTKIEIILPIIFILFYIAITIVICSD